MLIRFMFRLTRMGVLVSPTERSTVAKIMLAVRKSMGE